MTRARERWAVAGASAVTVALGVADYATGVEITFFVFTQIFPIGIAVWLRGPLVGVALATLATALGGLASLHVDGAGSEAIANVVGILGTLLVFVWMLARLRDHVERERRARRLAIEQLRHAERLHVIGVLAAGVAHELGTPLNVISGTAEMLEADEPDHARVILAQTERINAIVRHLLSFGRRGGAAKHVVDLNEVAGAAVSLVGATARKAGVQVVLETAPAPIRTAANGAELEQVISNLLLNGIQAMPGGGELRVKTGVSAGEASITVADRGIGIAPADLPHIFDPFFTTKGIGEGTGLGLSVSHGIVTDHGGAITVRSKVGAGSTFTVLLPAG